MKNVTVTLDEESARWARLEAARRDLSVSSLIRELLQQSIVAQESYVVAMHRYQARPVLPLKDDGRYPSRADVHERVGLR